MGAGLIHLVNVAKAYPVRGSQPKVVLQPTTIVLPAGRRLAVLGKKQAGKSTLLRILAGIEAPTCGRVTPTVRLSPLIKMGGLFHPRLSGPENVRFCARTLDLDPDQLMLAVRAHTVQPENDDGETREAERRKATEIALLTVLSFSCYLIDEIGHLAERVRRHLLDTLIQRRDGIIFSTRQAKLARQYADCAVVIRMGNLHPFLDVEEAITFNEG